MRMNGKKEATKSQGPINVETTIDMKKSIEANTKLNFKMNMKVNPMLYMER
jgi:hypothetical protein